MGVRKQHVKSADILHVWIWYPPRAQAYSPTTAANFFVFWTRCQWLIKHTAYHLNTALTLFLFLIFKSPRTSILPNCWPRKKGKFHRTQISIAALLLPRKGIQLWPGWLCTINTNVSSALMCVCGLGMRSDHKNCWARAGGPLRRCKFTFVLGLMK